MTFKDRDHFVLSTGREVCVNGGVIGLSPTMALEGCRVAEGWDGGFDVTGELGDEPWTVAERRELADYMIDLWQQWLEKAKGK